MTDAEIERAASEDAFSRASEGVPLDQELQSMSYISLCNLLSSVPSDSTKFFMVEAEKRRRDSSGANHIEPPRAVQELTGNEAGSKPNPWHENPTGKVWLTVIGAVVAMFALLLIKSHFGLGL